MSKKQPFITALIILAIALGLGIAIAIGKIAYKASKSSFGEQCRESGGQVQVNTTTFDPECVKVSKVTFPSVTPPTTRKSR